MKNFFKIFNLPASYEVDSDLLEIAYLNLQSYFHPDKARGENQKIEYLKKSADINEGYKILTSDILRAEYLLELEGVRVNKESSNTYPIPQSLLLEQMELREKVFEQDASHLVEIQKEVRQEFNSVKSEFSELYSAGDFEKASVKAVKLRFLSKLLEEIKKLKRLT